MADRAPKPPDHADEKDEPSAAHGFWRQLLDYMLANPLKVFGLAVLSFGGVLLLAFFTDIGYLPALDLQGIASMLYAVSLIGLALLVSVAGLLVAPGLLARSFLDDLPAAVLSSSMAATAGNDADVPPPAPRSRGEVAMTTLPWLGALVASSSLLGWLLFRTISAAWTATAITFACASYGH